MIDHVQNGLCAASATASATIAATRRLSPY